MTGTGVQAPAAATEHAELADLIAEAATGCPDVAGLTQLSGIPVATYLPGRTVSGVAVRPGEVEVCVVARYGGLPLWQVAEQVRQAVAPLVPDRAVDVVIGDIAAPEAEAEAEAEAKAEAETEAEARQAAGSAPQATQAPQAPRPSRPSTTTQIHERN